MKQRSRKPRASRPQQTQPRALDEPTLAQATGGDGPNPPPPIWDPEQHNQTLVRDRNRSRRARR